MVTHMNVCRGALLQLATKAAGDGDVQLTTSVAMLVLPGDLRRPSHAATRNGGGSASKQPTEHSDRPRALSISRCAPGRLHWQRQPECGALACCSWPDERRLAPKRSPPPRCQPRYAANPLGVDEPPVVCAFSQGKPASPFNSGGASRLFPDQHLLGSGQSRSEQVLVEAQLGTSM